MVHLTVKFCLVLLPTIYGRPSLFQFPSFYDNLAVSSYPSGLLQNLKTQFHSQDELGQYTYGYNDGLSSKIESKTADGITQGAYSYVDSNGIVQNVNYVSDDVNGFRVSASNMPSIPTLSATASEIEPVVSIMPTQPVIVENKAAILATPQSSSFVKTSIVTEPKPNKVKNPENPQSQKKEENATKGKEKVQQQEIKPIIATTHKIVPIAKPTVYTAPAPEVNYAPYVAHHINPFQFYDPNEFIIPMPSYRYAPVPSYGPVYSQYHSQDELGQYSYGYSGGPSSKAEMKTLDGVTRGGYSYVDANGILQKVSYVSDPINGFRVSASNLPTPNIPAFMQAEFQPMHEFDMNQISEEDKSKDE